MSNIARTFEMIGPGYYVTQYANLWSWLCIDGEWIYAKTPVINYLQNGLGKQSENANLAHRAFMAKLATKTEDPSIARAKTFHFEGEDYINQSITRCFIGKACPWELQETIRLGSFIGALSDEDVYNYCLSKLGVDCGGFVANFWGIGVPHMAHPTPPGATGFLPRNFWADTNTWPDVRSRRRTSATANDDGSLPQQSIDSNIIATFALER